MPRGPRPFPSNLPTSPLYLWSNNPGRQAGGRPTSGRVNSLPPNTTSHHDVPTGSRMSAQRKEENEIHRSLRRSVGGVPLLPPATPASFPGGVPNPTSVPELAVQFRVGARGLFQARTAIAVLVLLAPDQGISLRVKPAVCSSHHASESSRSMTKEEAGDSSTLRRRHKAQ
jgi:hypothetical protein